MGCTGWQQTVPMCIHCVLLKFCPKGKSRTLPPGWVQNILRQMRDD